eukprot:6035377-Ditylum_brightwellii.AAC.1
MAERWGLDTAGRWEEFGAQLTAGGVPIDVPVFWSHVVSLKVKTFHCVMMVAGYFQKGGICIN